MKLVPKWFERFAISVWKKSLSYRVLINELRASQPYHEQHSEEDKLATDLLFTKVPAVYAGVKAIAQAIAMVPIRVVGPNGRERPNHPLAKLLETPNDFDTTYDLMEQTAIFLELTGAMPWLLEGRGAGQNIDASQGGPPRTITPLHPNHLTPIPDPKKKISGWVYKVNNEEMEFNREQILYFKQFDPSDSLGIRGLGSATPATGPAIVDRLAARFNQKFFRRGAVLSGVIETDSEDIEVSTMEKYVEQFKQAHTGENVWDVRGLSHGLKWKPTQAPHKDMLFELLRRMNREEMLMCEGVPPIMVTLMDGATYANAQQQEFAFWIATILPKIRKIQARINRNLASRYGDNVSVLFDVSEIRALQPNWKDIKEAIVPLLERRTINPDEARQWLSTGRLPKLDDVEHGKKFLTNFQITELGTGLDPDEADTSPLETPDVEEDDAEDQVENLFSKMNRLAKQVHDREHRKRTAEERAALSRVIERIFSKNTEDLLARELKAVLDWLEENEELKGMTGQLKAPMKSPRFRQAIDDIGSILEQLEAAYVSKYTGVYNEGVIRSAELAASALPFDFEYTSGTVKSLAFIEREGATLVKNIHDTTVTALRAAIAEGIAEGETVAGISARVRGVLGPDASKVRARKIAQTETNKALNFGLLDSWGQTGVVEKKVWVHSGDELVRETHLDVPGPIGINELFQVGGASMEHPGDTSHGAPAEEVIGCRCSMDPLLAGEERSHGQAGFSEGDEPGRVRHARTPSGSGKEGKSRRSSVVAGRNGSSPEGGTGRL